MITIGADPEFFLMKDGEFFPACGLIGGDKEAPKEIGEGRAVLEDNVMVEFNIPPCDTKDMFITQINSVLDFLKTELNGYEFAYVPTAEFRPELLQSQKAQEFGCSPDNNIYDPAHSICTPPSHKRYAGGHIHLGYPSPDDDKDIELIKLMDKYIGEGAREFDKDEERRSYYGKLGTYRPKPYGFEYRSLSNFWLRSNDLMAWVFDKTQEVYERYMDGERHVVA